MHALTRIWPWPGAAAVGDDARALRMDDAAAPVADRVEATARDVALAQAGDSAALGRLLQAWQTPVYRFCLSMLRHESDAEDMAQETLVRAFRGLTHCRQPNRFRAWLLAIAANLCRDELRRRKRRPSMAALDAAIVVPAVGEGSDPEGRLRYLQATDRILSVLNPRQRAVLTLIDGLDLDYAETASTLSMSVAAVKSTLWRARQKVQREFPDPESV